MQTSNRRDDLRAKDCHLHSGAQNELNRNPYDAIMKNLGENQSGKGRHKCPYCAYDQGRMDYRSRMAEYLNMSVDDLPEFSD